ncbi:nucleotidyltransferase [Microlunatus endophyticus]|uniref:Nucleotidyltransferase n=1 Tax=Microlunatus endophyticus TaxID=1716077 RepID=A0A917W3F0_9ACTN|nr:nucleotidyltransferase [Microlunatus endophyticus]
MDATQVLPSVLLEQLREEIVAVAGEFHASDIRVFGSVAASSDTTASDLDVLIHFSDEATVYDQIGLTEVLESLLGVPVDVISDGASGSIGSRMLCRWSPKRCCIASERLCPVCPMP